MHLPKILKSIYLIVGTAIGTGILALPLATAQAGLGSSLLALGLCWVFMTLSAYYLQEITRTFRKEVDLVTMAKEIFGTCGQYGTWVIYLLLMYALTALYIRVGASWIQHFMQDVFSFLLPEKISLGLFAIFAMVVVYRGIEAVNRVNQIVTVSMLGAFCIVISLGASAGSTHSLMSEESWSVLSAMPLMLTAFGFSVVIPSISGYLGYESRSLKWTLLWGSGITLLAYGAWEYLAFSVIGAEGREGLVALSQQPDTGMAVVLALERLTGLSWIRLSARFFVMGAILSSLLGVGQALYHFILDGTHLRGTKVGRLKALIPTFGPPVLLLFLYPTGIQPILGLAGIFVAVLLGILPTAMIYIQKKSQKEPYMMVPRSHQNSILERFLKHKSILILVILFFIAVIGIGVLGK